MSQCSFYPGLVKSEIPTFFPGSFVQVPVLLHHPSRKTFCVTVTPLLLFPTYPCYHQASSFFLSISNINPFLFLSATAVSKTLNHSVFLNKLLVHTAIMLQLMCYCGYLITIPILGLVVLPPSLSLASQDQDFQPLVKTHSMESPHALRCLLFLLKSPPVSNSFSEKHAQGLFYSIIPGLSACRLLHGHCVLTKFSFFSLLHNKDRPVCKLHTRLLSRPQRGPNGSRKARICKGNMRHEQLVMGTQSSCISRIYEESEARKQLISACGSAQGPFLVKMALFLVDQSGVQMALLRLHQVLKYRPLLQYLGKQKNTI